MKGLAHHGSIVLMHGVRANRLEMLARAKFLNSNGFSVLLFDFQAHGESTGRNITFGFLESRDARAAFDWLKHKTPHERIGVLGMSLGGASAVLGTPPLDADAIVLEAVFASLDNALSNRLTMYLGPVGHILFPLLKIQIEPRLGFNPDQIRPAEAIGQIRSPLLVIAGNNDIHATLAEARQLFANANEPKELWEIPGATHVDFYRFTPSAYERRVGVFFSSHLAY